jgi:hypothetical protein
MENNQEEVKHIKIPRSSIDDMVDSVFKIHLDKEETELSNEFCRYYYASDDSEHNRFFALVFENNFIPQINVIDFLAKKPVNGLNNILKYSIVRLSTSKEERLVTIVNYYDPGTTLAEQLQKGETIKLQNLETIIESINNVISNLQDKNIFCCNINPSNILMKDGEFYALKEFINTYPNFHQEEQYLAPELIECHPAARYIKSSASDIYALGVSMFEAYTNKHPWNDHQNMQEYNNARFENGTSKYLLAQVKVLEKLRTFLKWTTHDDASVRWISSKITEWLEGKNSKITHESISDNKNTFGFNDNHYSTMKSLSYAIYNNWQEGIKLLKDIKLFKWASRGQISADTLEGIQSIVEKKSSSSFVVTNTSSDQKNLSKLLSLIDQHGSIRQEGLALSAASLPSFLHYLMINSKKSLINKIIKLLTDESFGNYHGRQKSAGNLRRVEADNLMLQINNIKSSSITKGVERLIYTLNPTMVCQSKLLKNKYITSMQELLVALDDYAAQNPKNFTIDRHIIAFVAAKMDLKNDIKDAILPNFPKFAEHPVIRGLSVLNVVQQHEPLIEITNICKIISNDLIEIFKDYLHNIEFKQQIISKIEEVAKEGSLEKTIHILTDQQQFINDYNGYYKACNQAKILEHHINSLGNQDSIFNNALLIGQKSTVLLSYVLCFIVTVTVIM